MLATMIIESGLAVYTFFRHRKGLFGKVVVAVLMILAAFQLSEFQICRDRSPMFWSRFGLVAVTLLPVLGLYLISLISHKRHFLRLGYVVATGFVIMIVTAPKDMISSFCGGNYVIFSGSQELFHFFSGYYFGFLVLGIWESLEALNVTRSKWLQRTLQWLVIGYLSFMLPMGIVYAIYAPARLAMASIMCGFAVILAFILAFEIAPKYYRYSGRKEA